MKLTYSHKNNLLLCEDRKIESTCNVKNELNKRREKSQIVRTIPKEMPYMPRMFPLGTWEVGKPLPRTDDYKRPYFIPTDAHQKVKVWSVENGLYKEPTDLEVEDYGYGLHYSLSSTTLGCIRIVRLDDLLWLVGVIITELHKEEKVYLEVVE